MINCVVVQGRLVKDVELRMTNNGKDVANFSLAVERNEKSQDGKRVCDFFDVVIWGSLAKMVARYFVKGQRMNLQGHLQLQQYKDRNGNNVRKVVIIGDTVSFCGDRRQGAQRQQPKQQRQSAPRQQKPKQSYNDYGYDYDEIGFPECP